MQKIKIGIIGLGRFGRLHLQILMESPHCEVVAVADKNQQVLDEVQHKYNLSRITRKTDSLLNDPTIDAIHVTTDESSHGEFVKKILEKEKHVFVEKPLAMCYEVGKEIEQLSKIKNKIVMVGNISRFSLPYISVKNNIGKNQLGNLAAIRLRRDFSKKWFEYFGKRVHPVYESGIHDIDLLLWYANSQCNMVFATENYLTGKQYPDLFSSLLTFDNGLIATLESSWLMPEGGPKNLVENLELDGTINAQMEVIGEKGTANVDLLNTGYSLWLDEATLHPDTTLWPYGNERTAGAIYEEVNHYLQQIMKHEESPISPLADSVEALRLADAIKKSAKIKDPVYLT